MKWIELLNRAVQYIEDNTAEEIDIEKAAHIAGCSSFHFQRMFAYIAGMPVSEYIRKRRMSLAALDLQRSDASILEISLKYGYNSPTAFNRAFQSIHGFPPSKARMDGTPLKSFSPISFKLTIQGVSEMNYRIEQRAAFRVVGISTPITHTIEENFKIIPPMWDKILNDGTVQKLWNLMDGTQPQGMLGICDCEENRSWTYIIGTATEREVPEGLQAFEIPQSTWAIFPGKGNSSDIQSLTQRIITEWFPSSGYKYGEGPEIEVYLDNPSDSMRFEIWIPIQK